VAASWTTFVRRAVENAPDYADLVAAGHCASPFTISVHVPRECRATKAELLASPGYAAYKPYLEAGAAGRSRTRRPPTNEGTSRSFGCVPSTNQLVASLRNLSQDWTRHHGAVAEPDSEAQRPMGMVTNGLVGKAKIGAIIVALGAAAWVVVEIARPDDETTIPKVDPESSLVGAAVEIEPAAGPLGTLLHFEGHGLQALFEGQGQYGRPIYLVRPDPDRDATLVARLRRGRVTEKGTMRETAWMPDEFEVRTQTGSGPWEKVGATPGIYGFAIDTPDNRIPRATFELTGADIGRAYAGTMYTHCGIESYGFDGSTWLGDPPLNDGQGNPPAGWGNPGAKGTFTLTGADRAVFRAHNGRTAQFRRVPQGQEPETRPCA
jgi:hypothetical protein